MILPTVILRKNDGRNLPPSFLMLSKTLEVSETDKSRIVSMDNALRTSFYRADETDPWEYIRVGFNSRLIPELLENSDFLDDISALHAPY
jgi:hypothetical protein